MHKLLTIATLMLICGLSLAHEAPATQDEAEDNNINIVAYYSKNDTTCYWYSLYEVEIKGQDTTTVQEAQIEYQIVVTDSTSQGYRLEVSTLESNYKHQTPLIEETSRQMANLMKDTKCILQVDEMGAIQHIENWKEIRDDIRKGIGLFCDSVYNNIPMMDSIMPRRQLESSMLLQFSTEQGVMSSYQELFLLFGEHGKAYKKELFETSTTNDAGYPTLIKVMAADTEVESDQDFEGDYELATLQVTTIPSKDAVDIAKNALGMLMTERANQQFEESGAMDQILQDSGEDMTATVLNAYKYFVNGWPKACTQRSEISFGGQKKITAQTIQWSSRAWM